MHTFKCVWARVILHKYSKTWAAIKNCVHLLYAAVKKRGSFHQNTAIPKGPACFITPAFLWNHVTSGFFRELFVDGNDLDSGLWTLTWSTLLLEPRLSWSMIFQKSTKSESICVGKTTSPWVLLLLRNNSDMLLVVVECPPFFAATLMSGMHKMNAWQDQWLKGLAF